MSASFRYVGHNHTENDFQPGCLMINCCHLEVLYFEHQTARTRRRQSLSFNKDEHKIRSEMFYHFHSETMLRHSSPIGSFIGFTCRYSRFLFQGSGKALIVKAFWSSRGLVSISLRK